MSDDTSKPGVAAVFASGRTATPSDRSKVQAMIGLIPAMASTPDQIPGLQYWLDASQPLYVSAGGARCVNAGDVVGVAPDQSGNGRIPTTMTALTYDPVGLNGKPTINFDGTSSKIVTPSFLDSSFDAAFTVFVVAKATGLAANKVMLGAPSNQFFIQRNGSTLQEGLAHPGATPPSANLDYFNDTGVTAFTYNGARTLFYYDKLFLCAGGSKSCSNFNPSIARTGNLGMSGALTIGDTAGGGFKWPGQISEVLVYNRAFTASELQSVLNYLNEKWALTAKKNLVLFGNSLTSGTGSTSGPAQAIAPTGNNYPGVLWGLLGSGWDVRTDAYPGRQTSAIITEAPLYGDLFWSPSAPRNIAVVWEVTNNLASSQSAAVAYRNIVKACQDRRAAGWKVIVGTCTPRSDGVYANFEADRQIVNGLIRANWNTFADGLGDIAADARLGAPGAQNNTTYFKADLVHFTDAGYSIAAGIFKTAIDTLS